MRSSRVPGYRLSRKWGIVAHLLLLTSVASAQPGYGVGDCRDKLGRYAEDFVPGGTLRMYSLKKLPTLSYDEFLVGGFENKGKDPVDPFRGSSQYPGTLQPGTILCVFMNERHPLGGSASAWVRSPDGRIKQQMGMAICVHDEPHKGIPLPIYGTESCPKGRLIIIVPIPGGLTQTIEGPAEQVRGLLAPGVSVLAALVADQARFALEQPGVWFPCASNGCCRAF